MDTLSAAQVQALGERYARTWRAGVGATAVSPWPIVHAHYTEPQRRYHALHHVARCLAELDAAPPLAEHPARVELALWYHDVVYVPGRPDNEARSAALFAAHATTAEPALVAAVSALILDTTHQGPARDPDGQLVCDIDLASLGADWAVYHADALDLRAEQTGPPAAYLVNQRTFLERLLERPQLYQTAHFQARYEARARANIQRYLALPEVVAAH